MAPKSQAKNKTLFLQYPFLAMLCFDFKRDIIESSFFIS